jgi:hypothetical protein
MESRRIGTMRKDTKPITSSLQYSIAPCFFAGFPLASAASRPATETQGPTAQLKKLAAGRQMNTRARIMQAPILPIYKKKRMH